MKSILTICQEVADLAAVKRPESLFSTRSMSDNIFLSVARSTLDSLLRYGDWPELTKEAIILTNPRQKNYPLSDICDDFYAMLPNTIYIKDIREKIIGSINPEDWMQSKYFYDAENLVKFKLSNGVIKFLNLPEYPIKIVFQYRADTVCLASRTLQEKSSLDADTDIPVFDDYLVKLGILWRWLKRSGLDYGEEYAEYISELKKKFAAQNVAPDILLGDNSGDIFSKGVKLNVKVLH